MDELAQRLSDASARLDPGWDESRVDGSFSRLTTRIRRRRLVRRGTAVAALVIVAGGLAWLAAMGPLRPDVSAPSIARRNDVEPQTERHEETAHPATIRLIDGSRVTPADATSEVVTVAVEPEAVTLRLDRGSALFDVVSNPARTFTVVAGQVSVIVVGTSFTVTRSGEQVTVAVHSGRVRVAWGDDHQELWTGGLGVFPPPVEASDRRQGQRQQSTQSTSPHSPLGLAGQGQRQEHGISSWKALAESGDFAAAHRAMEGSDVSDDVEDLLLAADVARNTGHPEQSVDHLRRIVESHGDDPRAPLAAFILGRVLLNQLGSPREAAEAFAQAQLLSPFGSLAEDALAREVEAWSRAGEAERARDRAERYQDLFPEGRRLRIVRHHGGLE